MNPKKFLEGHSQECDTRTRQTGVMVAPGLADGPSRELGLGPKARDPEDGSRHFQKGTSQQNSSEITFISSSFPKYWKLTAGRRLGAS